MRSFRINALSAAFPAPRTHVAALGVRRDVDTGSGYKAFPGMCLRLGTLHLVYYQGTAHISDNAVIKYRTRSVVNGSTWGSASTIATPPSGDQYRDPVIGTLVSGRLLCSYFRYLTGTGARDVKVITSDDGGSSWSSEYTIPSLLSTYVAGSGRPLDMGGGTILLPGYGSQAAANAKAVLWKSTDNGDTFPTQITIASSGSREYYEPQIARLSSGTLLCLTRSSDAHTWRTTSADNGATWAAPTDVLTASGRPDFVEIDRGLLLLFVRVDDSADDYPRWTYSTDEGLTWSSLNNVDNATDDWQYGAPVVISPDICDIVYALQNSVSDADLFERQYQGLPA